MKKKIVLAAVIFILALSVGCGQEDDSQEQIQIVEKVDEGQVIEEQTEEKQKEEQSKKEPSGEEQPKEEQSEEGQSIQQTEAKEPESQQKENTEFGFANLSDRVFDFRSGVGAWSTELFIHSDGTFEGNHHDADMGSVGDGYPGGTLYFCNFTGKFDNLEKVDEFTYKMKLVSIEYEEEPEKKEIIDEVLYIYSTAYGLDDGEYFYLYLPNAKLADLPEEYRSWVGYYNLEKTTETVLPFYGLYNINTGDGFSSSVYEKLSLSESIAMEISFAEESDAELRVKLQGDSAQLDMNTTSEELFQTWDDTLNIVWKLLVSELDDTKMEALRAEEREWIDFKDAEVKAAGQEYEGGSMQPFAEAMRAAELTKERVYELAKYAE